MQWKLGYLLALIITFAAISSVVWPLFVGPVYVVKDGVIQDLTCCPKDGVTF